MSEKDKNNNKLTWRDIVSILQIVIPILSPSGLQFFPFFSKLLQQLSLHSKISLPMLRLSIILMCFVILSLVYTSICLYKNRKLKLPNKKHLRRLLFVLLTNEAPCFFKDKYAEAVGFKESTITAYLKTLIAFGYLKDNGYLDGFINKKRRKSYTVTDEGVKYLVRCKYIW